MPISTRMQWVLGGVAMGLAGTAYAFPWPDGNPPWHLYLLDGRPIAAPLPPVSGAGFSSAAGWSAGALPGALRGSGTFRCPLGWRVRSWVHVIATLLHCDNATARFELRYLTLLNQVTYYETAGNRLYLFDAKHPQPLLGFTRPASSTLVATYRQPPPAL